MNKKIFFLFTAFSFSVSLTHCLQPAWQAPTILPAENELSPIEEKICTLSFFTIKDKETKKVKDEILTPDNPTIKIGEKHTFEFKHLENNLHHYELNGNVNNVNNASQSKCYPLTDSKETIIVKDDSFIVTASFHKRIVYKVPIKEISPFEAARARRLDKTLNPIKEFFIIWR